jgi:hypothetical protein
MDSHFSYYDIKRKVKIPEFNENLAEFWGILSGDGFLTKTGRVHRLGVCFHLKDDIHYSRYVKLLIKNLFNIEPTISIKKKETILYLLVHSKGITDFISENNFPIGIKKDKLKIPKWIANNNKFVKRYLRGLIDTDGCLFYPKKGTYKVNKYPVIEIKIHDKTFIKNIGTLINNLGFKVVRQKYKIQLNGIQNLNKWLDVIGFKNIKHITRYLIWKKYGFCPPGTNLKERLNLLSRGFAEVPKGLEGRTAMQPISKRELKLQNWYLNQVADTGRNGFDSHPRLDSSRGEF